MKIFEPEETSQPEELTHSDVEKILSEGVKKKWTTPEAKEKILSNFEARQSCVIDNPQQSFVDYLKTFFSNPLQPSSTALERTQAAEQIQAAFKGHQTRQKLIFPGQLISTLRDKLSLSLVSDEHLKQTALVLSREINDLLSKEASNGKSIRLSATSIHSYIPKFEENERGQQEFIGNEPIELLFNCWVQIPENGKTLSVLIHTDQKIGEGGFKIVNAAHQFEIKLSLSEGKREVTYQASTIARPRTQQEDERIGRKYKDRSSKIVEGVELHEHLMTLPGVKLVDVPISRLPDYSTGNLEELELQQSRFSTDLNVYIQKGTMPIDFQDSSKTMTLSTDQQLSLILDVVKTIEAFHHEGYVHRDLRSTNILLRLDEDKAAGTQTVGGYLSDFDLARLAGKGGPLAPIFYDAASRAGYVYPQSDCYGLGLTLCEMFLPSFDIREDIDAFKMHPRTYLYEVITKHEANLERLQGPNLQKKFSEEQSIDSIKEGVEKSLISSKLSQNDREILIELKKDLMLTETVIGIMTDTLAASERVLEYVKKNEGLVSTIENMETKLEGLAQLEAECNCLSAGQIRARLEELQKNIRLLSLAT